MQHAYVSNARATKIAKKKTIKYIKNILYWVQDWSELLFKMVQKHGLARSVLLNIKDENLRKNCVSKSIHNQKMVTTLSIRARSISLDVVDVFIVNFVLAGNLAVRGRFFDFYDSNRFFVSKFRSLIIRFLENILKSRFSVKKCQLPAEL